MRTWGISAGCRSGSRGSASSCPALLLNYFGQGALLLADPGAAANPFYLLAPRLGALPDGRARHLGHVIASQAVISGVFSITPAGGAARLPAAARPCATRRRRRSVRSTSPRSTGCCSPASSSLVLGFKSSSNLAAAYGIAVSAAMAIDAVLAGIVARTAVGWQPALVIAVFAAFLAVDLTFFRQCAQDVRGRLVPARHGCRGVRPDVDLAPRPRGHVPAPVPKGAVAALISDQPVAAAANAGPRHRGVPHCQSRHRAACAAAQPQAQQGPARAGRGAEGRNRGRAAGAGLGAAAGRAPGRELPPRRGFATASWSSRT